MKQHEPIRPRWTRQEIKTLRMMHKTHSNLEIAILLERSVPQVAYKAYHLALSKGKRRRSEVGRQNISKRWAKLNKKV